MTTTDNHRTHGELSTAPRERLLDRQHRPVVVGVLALVTLAAFENRAVQTILPVVVRDLDGWALFGASTGASLVTFTIALDVVTIPVGLAGWAAAATGMGLVSPALSTELLAQAAVHEQGRVSAAQGLASSTGVALQTALVGGVLAWFGPAIDGPRFAALMGVGALLALVGSVGAGRVRRS